MADSKTKDSEVRIWVFPSSLTDWIDSGKDLPAELEEHQEELERKARRAERARRNKT